MRKVFTKRRLIVARCTVLLLLIALILFHDDLLYARGFWLNRKGRLSEARTTLLRAIDMNSNNKRAPEAIYWIATIHCNRKMVTPNYDMEYRDDEQTGITFAESLAYYEKVIADYPESKWANQSLVTVGTIHCSQGDFQQANEYAEQVLDRIAARYEGKLAELFSNRGDSILYARANEIKINALIGQRKFDSALSLIKDVEASSAPSSLRGYDFRIKKCKATALKKAGCLLEAKEATNEATEIIENNDSYKYYSFDGEKELSHFYKEGLAWSVSFLNAIEYMAKDDATPATLTGTITAREESVPGAYVYLYDEYCIDEEYDHIHYDSSLLAATSSMTDEQGRFKFEGLVPGKYGIILYVPQDAVESYYIEGHGRDIYIIVQPGSNSVDLCFADNFTLNSSPELDSLGRDITFSWKPVEGAAWYDLQLSREIYEGQQWNDSFPWYAMSINKLTETSFTAPRESFYISAGMYSSLREAALGLVAPGEYYWRVIAKNSQGSTINCSTVSHFTINNTTLSATDNLLLMDDPNNQEEAYSQYLQTLSKNPTDTHSLLMAARMNRLMRNEHAGRTLQNAISYYRRYLQHENNSLVRNEMIEILYDLGWYEMALEEIETRLEDPTTSGDIHGIAGMCYFCNGNPEKAFEQFDQICHTEHDIYRKRAAVIALLCGDRDKLQSYTKHLPYHRRTATLFKKLVEVLDFTQSAEFHTLVRAGQYVKAREALTYCNNDISLFYLTLLDSSLDDFNRCSDEVPGALPQLYSDFIKYVTHIPYD